MNSFNNFRYLVVLAVSTSLILAPLGCSYKPSYLQKSAKSQVSQRWKVVKIDPSRLSADEASTYRSMGAPQYIRFFRTLSPERQRVYEWIYSEPETEPIRLVSFLQGKKVGYVVVDEDTTPLNERQKKRLFWTEIAAGTIGGLGLLYYLFFGRK